MPEAGRRRISEALKPTQAALVKGLAVCGLTPELSRTALRPWASENQWYLHEAAKRARLERIVRAQLCMSRTRSSLPVLPEMCRLPALGSRARAIRCAWAAVPQGAAGHAWSVLQPPPP